MLKVVIDKTIFARYKKNVCTVSQVLVNKDSRRVVSFYLDGT